MIVVSISDGLTHENFVASKLNEFYVDSTIYTGLKKLSYDPAQTYSFPPPDSTFVSDKITYHSNLTNTVNNALDTAVSRVQTTDAFLANIESLLTDMKDIADVSAQSGASVSQRVSLDASLQNIVTSINDYYQNSTFNDIKILQGGTADFNATDKLGVITIDNGNVQTSYLGIDALNITSLSGATTAQSAIVSAQALLNDQRTKSSAQLDLLQFAQQNNKVEDTSNKIAAIQIGQDALITEKINLKLNYIDDKVYSAIDIQGKKINLGMVKDTLKLMSESNKDNQKILEDKNIKSKEEADKALKEKKTKENLKNTSNSKEQQTLKPPASPIVSTPVITSPIVSTPVITSPIVSTPVSPIVSTPVSPIVSTPVISTPIVTTTSDLPKTSDSTSSDSTTTNS